MTVDKVELRRLAEAFPKTKMTSSAGVELLKRWIDLASPEVVLSLLDEAEYREDKAERAERNRDMWKEQCSAQAEQLESIRAEVEALRGRLAELTSTADHRCLSAMRSIAQLDCDSSNDARVILRHLREDIETAMAKEGGAND